MHVYLQAPDRHTVVGVDLDSNATGYEAFVACARELGIPESAWKHFRLKCAGACVSTEASVKDIGFCQGSFVEMLVQMRGGGGDGGSTGAEDRRAWLEMYQSKKNDKVDPEEARLAQWTACHISGMPLDPPCVADELGSLYNKEAVIQSLLTKTMPRGLAHITSLKHVMDIVLTPAKNSESSIRFMCPVTEAPMNGRAKFVLIRAREKGAAHVVSERAVKEFPEIVKEVVGYDWCSKDVIPLYPDDEELDKLAAEVLARRELEKAAKNARRAAKASKKTKINGKEDQKISLEHSNAFKSSSKEKLDTNVLQNKLKIGQTETVSAPANADPAIWQSLFTKRKGDYADNNKNPEGHDAKKKKTGNNDFMIRGGLKYVA